MIFSHRMQMSCCEKVSQIKVDFSKLLYFKQIHHPILIAGESEQQTVNTVILEV